MTSLCHVKCIRWFLNLHICSQLSRMSFVLRTITTDTNWCKNVSSKCCEYLQFVSYATLDWEDLPSAMLDIALAPAVAFSRLIVMLAFFRSTIATELPFIFCALNHTSNAYSKRCGCDSAHLYFECQVHLCELHKIWMGVWSSAYFEFVVLSVRCWKL